MDSRPDDSAQAIVNKAIISFPSLASQPLHRYVSQVLEWNRSLGLISRKEPIAACERLVLESLELDRHLALSGPMRVADVGSGAGFPGIIWAAEHEDAEVVLIERRERRATFLERAARTLDLENVTVIARDVRDVAGSDALHSSFDVVATMAVGSPADMGPHIEGLLRPGGRYATTVPVAAKVPAHVGRALHLESRRAGNFGCYAIYRFGI
jgi:16S rRNA (guanine527-N7)-methyltransferase